MKLAEVVKIKVSHKTVLVTPKSKNPTKKAKLLSQIQESKDKTLKGINYWPYI